MTLALARQATQLAPREIGQDVESAARYARSARAAKTVRAYAQQWGVFADYCAQHGAASLPAEPVIVAAWLASRADAGRSLSTVAQGLAAVCHAHTRGGHGDPRQAAVVAEVWQGIRRTLGGAAQRQAAPLLAENVRQLVQLTPADTLTGKRDRAVLLLGFASSLRREELTRLECSDLTWQPEGVLVRVRRSKTDQLAVGRTVAVPVSSGPACPVLALRAWLDAAGIEEGRLFRAVSRWGALSDALSNQSVNLIVKAAARRAGLDVSLLSAHSMRAGFVTSASEAGKSAKSISDQTGHRTLRQVNSYVRRAELWTRNPASGLL